MQWLSYLLFLLCPLMMIFCMRGHGGGHSHHAESHSTKDIDDKMQLLEAENQKLRNEIENLTMIVKKES
jgi:cell division protein FtsB